MTNANFHPYASPITIPHIQADVHCRKPAILSPIPSLILFTSLHDNNDKRCKLKANFTHTKQAYTQIPIKLSLQYSSVVDQCRFLADRTNGRAYATVLRPSVVVCNVMYCG